MPLTAPAGGRPLFFDTRASDSQTVGTPAPVLLAVVVHHVVDEDVEVNWLGHHVLHAAFGARCRQDGIRHPSVQRVVAETQRKRETSVKKRRWGRIR